MVFTSGMSLPVCGIGIGMSFPICGDFVNGEGIFTSLSLPECGDWEKGVYQCYIFASIEGML